MKTLGLNMIIGAGDGGLLERCFTENNLVKYFDERVLVVTTNDEEVKRIAKKYATKYLEFEWCSPEFPYGDFGGARNFALKNSVSDYVMWLDCDDIIEKEQQELKMSNIKKYIDEAYADVFVLPYIIEIDNQGNVSSVLMRERIFNRRSLIEWQYPIHEQLKVDWKIYSRVEVNDFKIIHVPLKDLRLSVNRNLQMLSHEYFHKKADDHTKFYFARELINSKNIYGAIPILVEIIKEYSGDFNYIFDACLLLANFFTYDKVEEDGRSKLKKETINIAENYLRIALALNPSMAEPIVYLGDIYYCKESLEKAIRLYKMAMSKKIGTGGLQQAQFYEELPAVRLSEIYSKLGEIEQALWYNKTALKFSPSDTALLDNRKKIIKELVQTL